MPLSARDTVKGPISTYIVFVVRHSFDRCSQLLDYKIDRDDRLGTCRYSLRLGVRARCDNYEDSSSLKRPLEVFRFPLTRSPTRW